VTAYADVTDAHVPTPDMAPDLDEVQQVEDPSRHLVPVEICGPVEARELPSKRFAARTVNVGTSAGVRLLSADPRRKFATIIARTQDILIGANQAQAQLNGAWVPGVVPFVITSVTEVWAVGSGAATDVSVIEEYFA
jgi:hypothetical protein